MWHLHFYIKAFLIDWTVILQWLAKCCPSLWEFAWELLSHIPPSVIANNFIWFTAHISTTYCPHTNDIPTTYQRLYYHIPTTYRPHTNDIPTTYQRLYWPHTNNILTRPTCSLLLPPRKGMVASVSTGTIHSHFSGRKPEEGNQGVVTGGHGRRRLLGCKFVSKSAVPAEGGNHKTERVSDGPPHSTAGADLWVFDGFDQTPLFSCLFLSMHCLRRTLTLMFQISTFFPRGSCPQTPLDSKIRSPSSPQHPGSTQVLVAKPSRK